MYWTLLCLAYCCITVFFYCYMLLSIILLSLYVQVAFWQLFNKRTWWWWILNPFAPETSAYCSPAYSYSKVLHDNSSHDDVDTAVTAVTSWSVIVFSLEMCGLWTFPFPHIPIYSIPNPPIPFPIFWLIPISMGFPCGLFPFSPIHILSMLKVYIINDTVIIIICS